MTAIVIKLCFLKTSGFACCSLLLTRSLLGFAGHSTQDPMSLSKASSSSGNKAARLLQGPLPVGIVAKAGPQPMGLQLQAPPPMGAYYKSPPPPPPPMGLPPSGSDYKSPPPPPPLPYQTSAASQWLAVGSTDLPPCAIAEQRALSNLKNDDEEITAIWPKVKCQDQFTDVNGDENSLY